MAKLSKFDLQQIQDAIEIAMYVIGEAVEDGRVDEQNQKEAKEKLEALRVVVEKVVTMKLKYA